MTKCKQAERMWERYQLLAAHARDIMLFVRSNGRIIEANAAAVAAYGYDYATLCAMTIMDLRDPATLALVAAQMGQADQAGILFETVHRRKDGSTFPVEVSSIGADLGEGRVLLSIIRDISERKRAAEEQARLYSAEQQARAAAEAAVQLRDEFLSVAAHELQTPLAALLGVTQLMQQRDARERMLADRERRNLGMLANQASRLNRLISNLLDSTRLTSGRLILQLAPVDLRALVARLVEELALPLIRHQIVAHLPDAPLLLTGDQTRLEQMVANLIQNALKYSPNGGTIEVQVQQHDASAVVIIRDPGIGIPAEAVPRLFTRYYRAPNTGTARIAGLGLGLFLVKQIVELHGGTVSVDSTEGQGSTFTVTLPCPIGSAFEE